MNGNHFNLAVTIRKVPSAALRLELTAAALAGIGVEYVQPSDPHLEAQGQRFRRLADAVVDETGAWVDQGVLREGVVS